MELAISIEEIKVSLKNGSALTKDRLRIVAGARIFYDVEENQSFSRHLGRGLKCQLIFETGQLI